MGKTTEDVKGLFYRGGRSPSVISVALERIAQTLDDLSEKQNFQEPALESLENKKVRALMIVIEKILCQYQNQHTSGFIYDSIFNLFKKAQAIKRAENNTDFQSAIADL